MPDPGRLLLVSARAREDIRAIGQYSVEMWDEDQADRYVATVYHAITTLSTAPEIGRSRDDLHPGLRFFAVAQHVIIYRFTEKTVRIIRILHARQDATRLFRR